MNRTYALALTILAGTATWAQASEIGFISTDRFGYGGTVTRYGSLADAQSGTNSTDTVNIADRDASIYVSSGSSTTGFNGGDDANIIMGSWWYSTAVDQNGDPRGAGWGNTHGNTGVGFMQLYDDDGSTNTSTDMSFGGFNGTHYTEFAMSLVGGNANLADDVGRMSVYDNVNDGGDWINYQLDILATGLEGTDDGTGFVTANNHPTGVTGTFTGIFQLTENQTSPANQGFYVVSFALNMDNWAWDNRDNLVGPYDQFFDSTFGAYAAVVPLPPAVFAGLGMLAGCAGIRSIRRRK